MEQHGQSASFNQLLYSFHDAVYRGDLDALKVLTRLPDINEMGGIAVILNQQMRDATPLLVAAANGHVGMVTWLLENGADQQAKDEELI